jgi:3-phosphoshikimate 1-carboxyvinyltransferase
VQTLLIKRKATVDGRVKLLPSSKSLSNRALILGALAGDQSVVSNLSSARDTELMKRLIGSEDSTIDVMDAGTTMRFLTGYFSIKGLHKTLTGSARMKERPIGLLVDALRALGVEIAYVEKEGFPPMEINGFRKQKVDELEMPGNVSSQYISSLMMVAPVLPHGLTIRLTGQVGSRPYIEMTAALMRHFGATCEFEGSTIRVPPSTYTAKPYQVEGDWSGASYWFAFVALADKGAIQLDSVTDKSLQGDRAIVQVMDMLGVRATFNDQGAFLEKKAHISKVEWNFAQCPDLAQTVLPVCAAKGIEGIFTGLESLRIKETDRIFALQEQLSKVGCRISEASPGTWVLQPGGAPLPERMTVETYHDHRMAMGLAPLATLMDLEISDPSVVNKSYPTFWDDMRGLNFGITEA